MKNVLDELYGFVYTKGLQRKPRDKGRGGAPGRRRRPMHKRVLTIDLKEMCIFSAGLIFETVLLDVRNKMKNVLDELNMYEYLYMATEDEIWEEMLKTEVSVDSVLKRIYREEKELQLLKSVKELHLSKNEIEINKKIDREEKELQLLKNEKDIAEINKKILAIEESIYDDKEWISMQKKSHPELVIPPPPKIDDIVANDPEIRRICRELSTFLETNANHSYVINYEQQTSKALDPSPLYINKKRSKPTDKLFYPTTFIEPVKHYVRSIPEYPLYNPQIAIAALEDSLNNTLSDANLGRASSHDVSSQESYMKSVYSSNQKAKIYMAEAIAVRIPGSIGHLNPLYFGLLKQREGGYIPFNRNQRDGMIETNIARQYLGLMLQLYRRIQAILVENGEELEIPPSLMNLNWNDTKFKEIVKKWIAGITARGKRKKTIKKGRKTRKTKMYKKIRTNRKK